jgi:hypothetical protein
LPGEAGTHRPAITQHIFLISPFSSPSSKDGGSWVSLALNTPFAWLYSDAGKGY